MSYNSSLPVDNTADIRENFRALKDDKIVDAATAVTADAATKLTTARTISLTGDATGSVSFDGSANVAIAVDVLSADTSAQCTGNAATATKFETARNINGVAFDGTADITITQINGKDIVTVDQLSAAVPVGSIVMWSGSIASIPAKWVLCNGLNGTPNLTNRFVLGAGNTYAVGATGGEATHTLTVNEMPSHSHTVEAGGSTNNDSNYTLFPWLATILDACLGNKTTSTVGGNQPHNNMPPYYALAYIMRIA